MSTSGEYGSSRFGWDAPARISTTAVMLQEATELLPGETLHGPVGFMPSIISGDGTSTSSDSDGSQWKTFPDQLDLYWYQGDDIQIPLYFSDPTNPTLDMSDESDWEWKSQIRNRHRFYSYEVNEFVIESEAVPPTPPATTPTGITLVTLFLPRQMNQYRGIFAWDLMSTSPFVGPVFPQPPDIDVWPPTTQVKTWLWGKVYVVPRVTATDWLPPPGAVPPFTPIGVTSQGWFVGPNGKVP